MNSLTSPEIRRRHIKINKTLFKGLNHFNVVSNNQIEMTESKEVL
jgi:hypothetical protein